MVQPQEPQEEPALSRSKSSKRDKTKKKKKKSNRNVLLEAGHSQLQDEKAQYRQQAAGSNSVGDSSRLQDEKAQYRQGPSSAASSHQRPQQQQQQQQFLNPTIMTATVTAVTTSSYPDQKNMNHNRNIIDPEPQVGAIAVPGPGRRDDDDDSETDTRVSDFFAARPTPVADAQVTPIPGTAQSQQQEQESVANSQESRNNNNPRARNDAPDDSGSAYRDEEQPRHDKAELKKKKKKKKSQRNFRIIVGGLVALVIALLVIVVVTVLLVGGSSGGDDGGGDENTQFSCVDIGGCDPGTEECQADAVCRSSQAHIDYWEASGCLGALDCGELPTLFPNNDTLAQGCDLNVGTQECHDNVFCRRRKNHVQLVASGKFVDSNGNPDSCETTPDDTDGGASRDDTGGGASGDTGGGTLNDFSVTGWTRYEFDGFEKSWGVWSEFQDGKNPLDGQTNTEWEPDSDWAITGNGCIRLEGVIATLDGIPLINERKLLVAFDFRSDGFVTNERLTLGYSLTAPGTGADWSPAKVLNFGTDEWDANDNAIHANNTVIIEPQESESTIYLRFRVISKSGGKIYLDNVDIWQR